MKLGLPIAIAGAFICNLACSTRLPPKGVNAFFSCKDEEAISVFKKEIKEGDKDYVLFNLAVLSAAVQAGDAKTAEVASLNAQRIMWSDAGKGRGVGSLVSAESIKIFKGEPFEKAMASVYSGILYFNQGDFDNARASFNKAVLAIRQKEPPHQEDFGLVFLLQAFVFLKMGEKDNARIALEKAQAAAPALKSFNYKDMERTNSLAILEVGITPRKVRKGPGASLVDWVRQSYPEQGATIYLDDVEIGSAVEAGDMTDQAKTKGTTGKDVVQGTKGVARDAAVVTTVIAADQAARGNKTAGWVALGTGVFALANQSQADVRQWELLPDRILALPMKLTPGNHTLRVRFRSAGGSSLPQYDQVWYVNVGADRPERILLFRSRRCPSREARTYPG